MLTEDPPIWLIIALAVGAAFVLFMLYSVLGKRVGRQPGDDPEPQVDRFTQPPDPSPEHSTRHDLADFGPSTALIRQKDPDFDAGDFLAVYRRGDEPVAVLAMNRPKPFTRWRRRLAAPSAVPA